MQTQTQTNKNISYSYKVVNSSKNTTEKPETSLSRYKSIFIHNLSNEGSFATNGIKDYFISFEEFKDKSNDHEEIGEYIIFTATKPVINCKLLRSYITFPKLYKAYYEDKQLENLTSLFFYKFQTIIKVEICKEDRKITVKNPYKELARQMTYPHEKEEFSHLVTITLPHPLEASLFEIMDWNRIFRKKINKGVRRLYQYIYKSVKDEIIQSKSANIKKIYGDDKEKIREIMSEIEQNATETARNYIKKYFKYFKVYELHKTGHLHAHFLINLPDVITKMDFKEIIKKFAKWFGTEPQGVDIKRIPKKDKKYAQRYVIKYLSKQFQNESLTYTIDEDGKKYYLLKKEALIVNDIPRMVSRTRNIQVKKFKAGFSIKYEENKEKKNYKETYRGKIKLQETEYDKVKKEIGEFRRRKASKEAQWQIENTIRRQETIEKLNWFIEYGYRELLEKSKYMNIDDEFKEIADAIYDIRHDKQLKEKYLGLYYKANKKLYYIEMRMEDSPIDF
jgi:hypothetical protein